LNEESFVKGLHVGVGFLCHNKLVLEVENEHHQWGHEQGSEKKSDHWIR